MNKNAVLSCMCFFVDVIDDISPSSRRQLCFQEGAYSHFELSKNKKKIYKNNQLVNAQQSNHAESIQFSQ